jgi:hypothetical protein
MTRLLLSCCCGNLFVAVRSAKAAVNTRDLRGAKGDNLVSLFFPQRKLLWATLIFVLQVCTALADAPWLYNTPVATVQKSICVPSPGAGRAAWVDMSYVGPNRELLRYDSSMASGDSLIVRSYRTSTNNGLAWSTPTPLPDTTVYYDGYAFSEYDDGPRYYDPATGAVAQTWLRRCKEGGIDSMTTYSRVSADHGITWSTPEMLRYEPGPEFDPNDPMASDYRTTNQGYFGSGIIKLANGKLFTALGDVKMPNGLKNAGLCFTGQWNATNHDYDWAPSNRVSSDLAWTPWLSEPDVAQLKDGRVLVVWRGTNEGASHGGHKYYSVGASDGATLGGVSEWRYDDGTNFYSPSSVHRLIRNSATGKLYWIGNIASSPPSGNSPRYPLVIAEVNETGTPSLKKHTVTLIDDRQDDPSQPSYQSEFLQLSNFSLLENRETHDFDLYLSALGELSGSNPGGTVAQQQLFWTANNYKYTIDVAPEPSSLVLLGAWALLVAAWGAFRRRGTR